MKFSDLEFKTTIPLQREARVTLKNGYTAVIRTGYRTATTLGAPYEYDNIPRNADISDDVIGYCTKEDIINLINETSSKPCLH